VASVATAKKAGKTKMKRKAKAAAVYQRYADEILGATSRYGFPSGQGRDRLESNPALRPSRVEVDQQQLYQMHPYQQAHCSSQQPQWPPSPPQPGPSTSGKASKKLTVLFLFFKIMIIFVSARD
jgi:hypothetical protein